MRCQWVKQPARCGVWHVAGVWEWDVRQHADAPSGDRRCSRGRERSVDVAPLTSAAQTPGPLRSDDRRGHRRCAHPGGCRGRFPRGARSVCRADDDQSSVLLNIGAEVAAGVVAGGTALTGARHAVGAIGHLRLDSRGGRCRCGAIGCSEAGASGAAISRMWPRSSDGSAADSLLTSGSRTARRARQRVLDAFAAAVEGFNSLVDPHCVVLGGGVSEVGEVWLVSLQLQLRLSERRAGRPVAQEAVVVLAPSPRVLGAIGAALATRTRVEP